MKRYLGEIDRHDNTPADWTGAEGRGGGYHVTYDDGDEELLGEIVGRDDVRLLDEGGHTDNKNTSEVN